jgi:type I restriction-modification system DNA methylase subunit
MKKILDKIAYRHSINQVFDDFLHLVVCAFSMQRIEDEYFDIMRRYNPEEMMLFSHALAEMIALYDKKSCASGNWTDVLGEYFEEIISHFSASAKGQFFTPDSICNLMASILNEDKESEERIYVNDCACGSGRNLIAHSRLNPNRRLNSFYIAQDIDFRCVMMSVINFVMFGMSGVIIHMDTISMNIYRGFRVFLPETGMFIYPLTANQCFQYVGEVKINIPIEPVNPKLLYAPAPAGELFQLSLF